MLMNYGFMEHTKDHPGIFNFLKYLYFQYFTLHINPITVWGGESSGPGSLILFYFPKYKVIQVQKTKQTFIVDQG